MKFDENKLELLVDNHHGIYIPQVFSKTYKGYIYQWCEQSKDLDFKELTKDLENPDEIENYNYAWDVILSDEFRLINDDGIKMIVTQNEGDVWAYPENMDIPEDFWP